MIKLLKCIVVFMTYISLTDVSGLKQYYINVDVNEKSSYRIAFSLNRVSVKSENKKQNHQFGDLKINIYHNGDIIGQLPAVMPYTCLSRDNQSFFDGIFRKYLWNMITQDYSCFLERYGVHVLVKDACIPDEIWGAFSKNNYSVVARYNFAEDDELISGATLGQILTATTNWRMFFAIMKKKAGVFTLDISIALKNNIPIDWNCYAHTQYIKNEMSRSIKISGQSNYDFFACEPGVLESVNNGFRYFSELTKLSSGSNDINLRENSFKFFCFKLINRDDMCDENDKAQLAQTYAYISYLIDLMIRHDMLRVKMMDLGYYCPYAIEYPAKRELYRNNLITKINRENNGKIIDASSNIELIQQTIIGRLAKDILKQARIENTSWLYFKDIHRIGRYLFNTDISELRVAAGFKAFSGKYNLSNSSSILNINDNNRRWLTYYSLEFMSKSVVLRALLSNDYTPSAYAYTPEEYTEKQHVNNLRRIIKLIWYLNKDNIVSRLCMEAAIMQKVLFMHTEIDNLTNNYSTNLLLRVLVDLDILEPISAEVLADIQTYRKRRNRLMSINHTEKTYRKNYENIF